MAPALRGVATADGVNSGGKAESERRLIFEDADNIHLRWLCSLKP
jgi:hypothetical protein